MVSSKLRRAARGGPVRRAVSDLAIDAAVNAVCDAAGVHDACPIAIELINMARDRERDADPRVPVPVSQRVPKATRPEEKRDRIGQLVPEAEGFRIPPTWPLAFAPRAIQSPVIRGMVRHVMDGVPVGAGGRITRGIYEQLYPGGRRLKRRAGVNSDIGFVPGETGF